MTEKKMQPGDFEEFDISQVDEKEFTLIQQAEGVEVTFKPSGVTLIVPPLGFFAMRYQKALVRLQEVQKTLIKMQIHPEEVEISQFDETLGEISAICLMALKRNYPHLQQRTLDGIMDYDTAIYKIFPVLVTQNQVDRFVNDPDVAKKQPEEEEKKPEAPVKNTRKKK